MDEYKGKILVVDDDPALLLLLVDTLTSIGYVCVSASDGVEALRLLEQHEDESFDLVVTDIKMPNMDGFGLLNNIRQHHRELPVLFITAVATEEIIAEASPDGYLVKPFRIRQIEELIEQTLAAQRAGRRFPKPRSVLLNLREGRFRDTLSEALICSHYLPFAVSGGDEALEELERGSFHAMISGIENEESKEEAAVTSIRRKHPNLAMLLLSSSLSTDERNNMRSQMGVDAFLQKPCDTIELIETLDRAVGRHDSVQPAVPPH